jgi:hypothetical protein
MDIVSHGEEAYASGEGAIMVALPSEQPARRSSRVAAAEYPATP